MKCFTLFGLFVVALSGSAGVTPVQKVLQMLDSMQVKAKEEKHQEQVLFGKFKQFCELTSADKSRRIAAAENDILDLGAAIATAEADADKLGAAIADLNAELQKNAAEGKAASALRAKEKVEFDALHLDYTESIDALERAVSKLKTVRADVPQEEASEALLELRRSSKLLQNRIPMDLSEAFLQLHSKVEQGAPEANAYEFQSAGVVDMLQKLRQRFKAELNQAIKEEMNRKHSSQMLMQKLHDDSDYATKTSQAKAAAKAGKLKEAADAKGDLAQTQAAKKADETYLSDLKTNCHSKSDEFEARQTLRAGEIEAIQKAIEIISSPDVAGAADTHLPTFVQLQKPRHATVLAHMRSSASPVSAQQRAATLLMQRATESNNAFLKTIAGRVAGDVFEKVKKMIKELVVRLMEEANEESDHKGWCDHELGTNKQTRDELGSSVESLTAQVDEGTALMNKLTEEIGDLSDAIAELEAATATATKDRQEEKATNAKTVAESKAALSAVDQAMKILRSFYAQAADATAFVQQKRQDPVGDSPTTWDSAYTGQQGDHTGVVGMLEVIRSDFARLEADTSSSEDEAQREYDAFMEDSAVTKAVKDKEMRHKGFKKESTRLELNRDKKELEETQTELTAALSYYDKLKPSCINSGHTYEDRVGKRQEEIQSLQEALKILNGEDLA